MLRDKIIEVTADNLLKFGIKECRMDSLASSVRVSKKTIYDLFGSKQNLLRESICYMIDRYKGQIESVQCDDISSLEAILLINSLSLRHALECSPSFYNDIDSNVELSTLFMDGYVVALKQSYGRQFKESITGGLIAQGINIDDTLRFFEQQIRIMCKENSAIAIRKMDDYTFIILTHLSGICTDKGREALSLISMKNLF